MQLITKINWSVTSSLIYICLHHTALTKFIYTVIDTLSEKMSNRYGVFTYTEIVAFSTYSTLWKILHEREWQSIAAFFKYTPSLFNMEPLELLHLQLNEAIAFESADR